MDLNHLRMNAMRQEQMQNMQKQQQDMQKQFASQIVASTIGNLQIHKAQQEWFVAQGMLQSIHFGFSGVTEREWYGHLSDTIQEFVSDMNNLIAELNGVKDHDKNNLSTLDLGENLGMANS